MTAPAPNPRVGVAAVLLNAKGELVLGKRAGSHGSGKLEIDPIHFPQFLFLFFFTLSP